MEPGFHVRVVWCRRVPTVSSCGEQVSARAAKLSASASNASRSGYAAAVNLLSAERVHEPMEQPVEAVTDDASVVRILATHESFEDLFLAERRRLLEALVVITANRAEAEELAQDA